MSYASSESDGDEGEPVDSITNLSATSLPTHTTEGQSRSTAEVLQARAEDSSDRNAVNVQGGPVLGPLAPTNGQSEDPELDNGAEQMSERDAIRYLTQAPVPMTSMPPSPPGSPNPAANAKFARFQELKAKGVHFNQELASKPGFLNPGLLSTLMSRMGVEETDQYNTSLALDVWNPQQFPEWAYKEQLLESQKAVRERQDAEKKALSATGQRRIDFTTASGDSGNETGRPSPRSDKRRTRL